MTHITVDDRTGSNPKMAALANEILTAAAPLVEKTGGLPLPPTITCTLHDPHGRAADYADFIKGLLQRETAGKNLTTSQHRRIAKAPLVTRMIVVRAGHPVDVVTNSILQPRLLFAPDAMRLKGQKAPEHAYEQHLIEALVTAGQISTSQGAVVPQKIWPYPHKALFHPSWYVTTGHARWTAREVCAQLGYQPPHSSTAQSWSRRAATLLAAPRRRMSDDGRAERAAAFVQQAIEMGTIDTFNRVWTEPELLPTRRERSSPQQWVQRISVHPAAR